MEKFRGLPDSFSVQCYLDAATEYSNLLAQQEDFWKQRAKQHWLQAGDSNSKYFHAYASSRRRKNYISQLKDDDGTWKNWKNGLGDLIKSYFDCLFQTRGCDMEYIADCIKSRVSPEQNEHLTQEFSSDEVKEAIFSMHPDKSPGPDGMNPAFYQHFWKIIGNDIVQICLHVLESGIIPDNLNDTLVVLIPKKNSPESIRDLRPISLCNVLMKIITKMLANRLKVILPDIIYEAQSAFIPGRLITDNVIAAFEINHWLHRKRKGKIGYSALKLDMSKAYDRVEWDFIMGVMVSMGFSSRWINWMSLCVTTVKYNFLVSGKEVGQVSPGRGLRQGDPISPYLFLLCAEGLSALIQRKMEIGALHGCKIANRAPIVTHLFFADDCYLFFRASSNEALCIRQCLEFYEQASGQQVNFQKSSIHFSYNTSEEDAQTISDLLQVPIATDASFYLGLPSSIGRNRWEVFRYIKEKVWNRMQCWKGKMLSRAGKEILIKSVIQSIPSYVMSVFILPKKLCGEIERMMNRFWWVSNGENRTGIRWMCWDRLCIPKKFGGMGFRRIRDFNLAMLGKQAWRLMTDSTSFIAKLLKSRYYPSSSFSGASLGSNPSYVWRSILAAKDLVITGSRKRVGKGNSINIWGDPWIPDINNPWPTTPMPTGLENSMVNSLFCVEDRRWDSDIINDIFNDHDKHRILKIPLSLTEKDDSWMWMEEENGRYSVKNAYRILSKVHVQNFPSSTCFQWQKLWGLLVPPKVKNFMWRLVHQCLPTLDLLKARHVDVESLCLVCNRSVETIDHILRQCSFASRCWELVGVNLHQLEGSSIIQYFFNLFAGPTSDVLKLYCVVAWSIWAHRNQVVWHKKFQTPVMTVNSASSMLFQWEQAQAKCRPRQAVTTNQGNREGAVVWQKPIPGWLTCNVDVATCSQRHMSFFGCLIRDEAGTFVVGTVGPLINNSDPKIGEALALREALSWLKRKHMSHIFIEVDSLTVVQALRRRSEDLSYFGSIISDCVMLLKDLGSSLVYFVRRSANIAAHIIAREASSLSDREEWLSVPFFLIDVLSNDG